MSTQTTTPPSIGTQIAVVEYQLVELRAWRDKNRRSKSAVSAIQGEILELENKLDVLRGLMH